MFYDGREERVMFRGAFRDGRMEDGDVYGEAVNIASRLEGLSPPEGVAVSEKVFVEIAEIERLVRKVMLLQIRRMITA